MKTKTKQTKKTNYEDLSFDEYVKMQSINLEKLYNNVRQDRIEKIQIDDVYCNLKSCANSENKFHKLND